MADHIQRFTAKNYGCLRDVTVELTPLHAFVGPNDSGKSTLLRGVRTVVQLAGDKFQKDDGEWQPFDPGISGAQLPGLHLGLRWGELSYDVSRGADRDDFAWQELASGAGKVVDGVRPAWSPDFGGFGVLRQGSDSPFPTAREHFARGARLLRLDPDALREPSSLIARSDRVRLHDEHGRGLAGVYDVILNQHLEGYVAIREEVRRLFPSIKTFGLENVSDSEKEIRVQLTSGEWIPAKFMSEGLLYYLAFAAIKYLDPACVLLIEEPENGLHPARISEVMRILRDLSATTQVVLATHSPLVINEMSPEEVTVVTRNPDEGTKVTLMKDTANFKKRSSVYALGELWLSFADGIEEAPLLHGRAES